MSMCSGPFFAPSLGLGSPSNVLSLRSLFLTLKVKDWRHGGLHPIMTSDRYSLLMKLLKLKCCSIGLLLPLVLHPLIFPIRNLLFRRCYEPGPNLIHDRKKIRESLHLLPCLMGWRLIDKKGYWSKPFLSRDAPRWFESLTRLRSLVFQLSASTRLATRLLDPFLGFPSLNPIN